MAPGAHAGSGRPHSGARRGLRPHGGVCRGPRAHQGKPQRERRAADHRRGAAGLAVAGLGVRPAYRAAGRSPGVGVEQARRGRAAGLRGDHRGVCLAPRGGKARGPSRLLVPRRARRDGGVERRGAGDDAPFFDACPCVGDHRRGGPRRVHHQHDPRAERRPCGPLASHVPLAVRAGGGAGARHGHHPALRDDQGPRGRAAYPHGNAG